MVSVNWIKFLDKPPPAGFARWTGPLLAKALGGGLPLGAFCASSSLLSVLAHDPPLGHITTFGGHPLTPLKAAKSASV